MASSRSNTRSLCKVYNSETKNNYDGTFTTTFSGRTTGGKEAKFRMRLDFELWPYIARDMRKAYAQHRESTLSSLQRQNEAFNLPPAPPTP